MKFNLIKKDKNTPELEPATTYTSINVKQIQLLLNRILSNFQFNILDEVNRNGKFDPGIMFSSGQSNPISNHLHQEMPNGNRNLLRCVLGYIQNEQEINDKSFNDLFTLLWNSSISTVMDFNKRLSNFMNMIEDFRSLPVNDQRILLKNSNTTL